MPKIDPARPIRFVPNGPDNKHCTIKIMATGITHNGTHNAIMGTIHSHITGCTFMGIWDMEGNDVSGAGRLDCIENEPLTKSVFFNIYGSAALMGTRRPSIEDARVAASSGTTSILELVFDDKGKLVETKEHPAHA